MTNVRGDWPPLEGIKWPKTYATTEDYPAEFPPALEPDGVPVYVKALDPEEAQQARREIRLASAEPIMVDDGARLDTPENHRIQTLQHITDSVTGATNQAEIARRWSAENGYHPDVAKRLAEIVRDLRLVKELIDTHERNR